MAVDAGAADGLTVPEFIGRFYADFFLVVNAAGLVLQLFVVSRLLRRFGVRIAILVLPVIALAGYTVLAFLPVLAIVRWVKTAENSTEYSLQNTVRNILFLPTSREQKYKAKQAIDSFFVRAGDVLSALCIYLGTTVFAFKTTQFSLLNLVLACGWMLLAVLVGREYAARTVRTGAGAT